MAMRTDVMGRASLVTGNLLQGDLAAAGRAALSPESLAPEEMKTLVERLELDKGPFAPIFETLTNPIFVIGFILAGQFPVAKLKDIFKVGQKLAKAQSKSLIPPWTDQFRSPLGIFGQYDGTGGRPDLLNPLLDVLQSGTTFMRKHAQNLINVHTKYVAKVGRDLSTQDNLVAAALLDGLDDELPAAFANFARPGTTTKGTLRTPFALDALQVAATPELREFADGVRTTMNGVYVDIVLRDPALRSEVVLAMTKRIKGLKPKTVIEGLESGTLDIPDAVREALKQSPAFKTHIKQMQKDGFLEIGEQIAKYFPHQLPRDMAQFDLYLREFIQSVKGDPQRFARRGASVVDKMHSDSLLPRFGRTLPDPRDLERVPHLLDPVKFEEFKTVLAAGMETVEGTQRIAPYSLDFGRTIQRYMNQMKNVYAFNQKGAGRRLLDARDALAAGTAREQYRAGLVDRVVIPMAAGKNDFQRTIKAQYWLDVQDRINEFMAKPTMKKALGEDLHGWMMKKLSTDRGPFSMGSVEDNITSLFYHSTLGGNVGSAALQTMQSLISTAPLLWADAARGFNSVIKKSEKYFAARGAGKAHMEAVGEAFPEFVESGLGQIFLYSDEAVMEGLRQSYDLAVGSPLRRGWTRAKQGLMFLFERAELVNQLTAFESAMVKGLREGLTKAETIPLAHRVVMETQFPPSFLNSPLLLQQLKGMPGGRLASMFGQFGLRQMEFLGSLAPAAGTAEKAGFLGRNWGTLGRAMMISAATYELGRGYLGADLSRGLVFGSLPEPREGSPFYPFPFVPPAASIAGGLAMDVLEGKIDKSRYALPLMLPGGIGVSRLVGFASPEAAQKLGRKYVDYNAPAPDGRFALYSAGGPDRAPSLVGFLTPAQLIAQGLGLPGKGELGRETQAMEWLISNRDRIRGMKRSFLEAQLQGNYADANAINDSFKKAYGIPRGMSAIVRKQDIEAIHLRRNVTRLERVMDTLPAELRPTFAQAIQQAVLNTGSDLLGIDPALLRTGTVRQRAGARPSAGTMKGGWGQMNSVEQGQQSWNNRLNYQIPDPLGF